MRFVRASVLGVFGLLAACSGSTEVATSGTTSGSGGAGGGATTSTTSVTSTTSSTGTGGMLDNGMPSDVYPAPHPKPPIVINYGGPVLAAPKIVPVFFSNDDSSFVTAQADFVAKIGATNYWTAVTSEYGVGPATSTDPVMLTETATGTIDDNDIQNWLAGKLNGDDPAFPPADDNTVYLLTYPAGATITAQGAAGCQEFGGYHSNITLDAAHGSQNVAYAVIPRCASFGDLQGIDGVTGTTSHELVEAATDPYPMLTPAYAMMDDQHIYWLRLLLGGGETGDMCAQFDGVFTKFTELNYVVQRSWSNKAALAGHDPCQPTLPNSVYFNAAPDLKENVTASIQGQQVIVKGAKIALGETKTIDLDLFSDGDTGGPFDVEVKDMAAVFGQTPRLGLTLDRTSGQNGEKLHLTITVMSEGKNKTESFIVVSSLNGQRNFWVGIVGSQ
jgi:hypothetical protein